MRGRLTLLGFCLIAIAIAILAAASAALAQEIKLKLSHFLPAAHNHHVNVIVPWVEEAIDQHGSPRRRGRKAGGAARGRGRRGGRGVTWQRGSR